MPLIPTFTHPKLRQFAEAVAQSLQLYGGPNTLIRKVADGWYVSEAPEASALSLSRRTVALVGVPEAIPLEEQPEPPEPPAVAEPLVLQPLALTAREVRYKSFPPLVPETQQDAVVDHLTGSNIVPGYEFASGEFRVYPAIGWSVDEYEPFVLQADAALDRKATYLYGYLENSIWILDRPPIGGVTLVVVRDIRDDGDHHVKVQKVRLTPGDVWDGLMRPMNEAAFDVPIFPHYKARDFRPFVTRQGTFTRETPILYLIHALGSPWLVQDLRFDLIQPRDQLRLSDCITAFVEDPR